VYRSRTPYPSVVNALIVIAICAAGTLSPAAAGTNSPTDDQVKAAFLYNFAKFVTWPEESFPGPDAPIRVVILGETPIRGHLATIVEGKKAQGRRFEIASARSAEDLGVPHVVFIAGEDAGRVSRVLGSLNDPGVLTIGDCECFLGEGGMISFVVRDRKIRFQINSGVANDAGIEISSKLLSLGETVVQG